MATTLSSQGNGGVYQSDWLRDRRLSWLWSAAFILVGAGWLAVPGVAGALISAAGFVLAGGLCVVNAVSCRRVHCAFTGPLYLVAAALFLARAAGWDAPAALIIAGAIAGTGFAFVPEWLGKRYFTGTAEGSLAAMGTLVAGGLVAACCLGPTLFVLFGVSLTGLSALGALEPYRPLFLLAGMGSWALAYRQRRQATAACAEDACGTPVSRRLSGVLLWGSLVALVIAAGYPYAVARFAG
jgi:mercuric ion transport protein